MQGRNEQKTNMDGREEEGRENGGSGGGKRCKLHDEWAGGTNQGVGGGKRETVRKVETVERMALGWKPLQHGIYWNIKPGLE